MEDPAIYKGSIGPLVHRCHHCKVTESAESKLPRCSACRAVRYCSVDHLAADRPNHRSICNKIKKARKKIAEENDRVRNATPDFATPANAFETNAGQFWGIYNTQDYMRARFALAQGHLLKLGTLDGVSEALEHLKDMLRLCRSDNMGLRNIVPCIMLRLDLDQECYDFVKWWSSSTDGYDWDDMDLPYLDIRGADVFEDPAPLIGNHLELNHAVSLLLLKLKLLVDILNVKTTRKVLSPSPLPVELQKQVEQEVVRSPLSATPYNETADSLLSKQKELVKQIRLLGATVVKSNESFMFSLFNPDEALSSRPESYSIGSWEEMALSMKNCYSAWWETEGVLRLLEDARACASRDSEDEVGDFMDHDEFGDPEDETRAFREMLADVSVNRIWGYLNYAVENATYLGPWSERPSEIRTRDSREAWMRAIDEEAELLNQDLGGE